MLNSALTTALRRVSTKVALAAVRSPSKNAASTTMRSFSVLNGKVSAPPHLPSGARFTTEAEDEALLMTAESALGTLIWMTLSHDPILLLLLLDRREAKRW